MLRLPARLQIVARTVHRDELRLQLGNPRRVHRETRIAVAPQGSVLALRRLDLAGQILQGAGAGGVGDLHPRRRRIQQVDPLVRVVAARDVARRERRGSGDRGVGDVHLVRRLVAAAQATEHPRGTLGVRLLHLHRLEAARQGRVLLEVFLVLRPGGGGDRTQLPTRQRWFEEVGGVAAAGGATRADQGVGLVDEQDDRLRRCLHLVDHPLQAVLELPLDRRARLQQPHVEAEKVDPLEDLRHVVLDDAQGQPLHQGGLPHPGLADHDRVVLPPPPEDVDHLPDLPVTAKDRVDAAGARLGGEVDGEPPEGRLAARTSRRCARPWARRRHVLGGAGDDGEELAPELVGADLLEQVEVGAVAEPLRVGAEAREEDTGADVRERELHRGEEPRLLDPLHQGRREDRPARVAPLQPLHRLLHRAQEGDRVDAEVGEDLHHVAIRVIRQLQEQVLHGHFVVAARHAHPGGPLQGLGGARVETLQQGLELDTDHGGFSRVLAGPQAAVGITSLLHALAGNTHDAIARGSPKPGSPAETRLRVSGTEAKGRDLCVA